MWLLKENGETHTTVLFSALADNRLKGKPIREGIQNSCGDI